MNVRVIFAISAICLAFVAAIIPQKENRSLALKPTELLKEVRLETYKISVDELSDIIIQADPSYLLIDLRSEEEYKKYHLPGAIHLPFDSIFSENWIAYLDQDLRKNVFYGNGDALAIQAFVLSKQRGFTNNFVLEGGLNEFYTSIYNVKEPKNLEDDMAYVRYQKRLAAQQFFTGKKVESNTDLKNTLKPIPKRKKKTVEGGCS